MTIQERLNRFFKIIREQDPLKQGLKHVGLPKVDIIKVDIILHLIFN